MSAKHYPSAREVPVKQSLRDAFNAGAEAIKKNMRHAGYTADAVESLQFDIKAYTLTTGADGGFHVYADGQPFFEMSVSAPGTLWDLVRADTTTPMAQQSDTVQALALYQEVMNAVMLAPHLAKHRYGLDNDMIHDGFSSAMPEAELTTVFRCDPIMHYLDCLDDILKMRLAPIGPATSKKPPPPKPL